MNRTLLIGSLALALAACQMAPEDRRDPITPLPDKVKPLPYGQLLQRARNLGLRATEASHLDRWAELEEYAQALEQTAQFLPKADDVPSKHVDTIKTMSADLGKYARQLKEAATAKNADKVTEALASINRKVREMKLGDGSSM